MSALLSSSGLVLLAGGIPGGEANVNLPTSGAYVSFWALAVLVIGGAIVTITRRNAVSAVMALVATFFGLAGMYLMLSAEFLAAIQVLVYAGAIMTLFVFVVMVLNREEAEPFSYKNLAWKAIGVTASVYLAVKAGHYLFGRGTAGVAGPVAIGMPPAPAHMGLGSVTEVGWLLFHDYLFPFEALSLMLLVAVIGAVVVARTPKKTVDEHGGGLTHHHDAPGAIGHAEAGGH